MMYMIYNRESEIRIVDEVEKDLLVNSEDWSETPFINDPSRFKPYIDHGEKKKSSLTKTSEKKKK